MTTQDYYAAFQKAVPEVFGFLGTEFGYQLQQDGEWIFYAVTTHSVITIWLERAAPLYPEVKFQRRGKPWPIGVGGLAKYYDRNWRPVEIEFVYPQDIRPILEQAAQMLRHYGSRLLRGDFSEWSKIQEWLRETAIRGAEEREEQSRIAVQADRALENKDYALAVMMYEKLKRLRPEQRRHYEEAKQELAQTRK